MRAERSSLITDTQTVIGEVRMGVRTVKTEADFEGQEKGGRIG